MHGKRGVVVDYNMLHLPWSHSSPPYLCPATTSGSALYHRWKLRLSQSGLLHRRCRSRPEGFDSLSNNHHLLPSSTYLPPPTWETMEEVFLTAATWSRARRRCV